MNAIYILVVDDEASVLELVLRDIAEIEDFFPIETAASAAEARAVTQRLLDSGAAVGLILCDHIMPGDNGVQLLIEMHANERLRATRKVLLTGQAGLDATVSAVNRAGLAHYVRKPWKADELVRVVREQLTRYIIDAGRTPDRFLKVLDSALVSEALHRGELEIMNE